MEHFNQNPRQTEEQQRENWKNPQPQYQNQQGEWVPNPNYPNPQFGGVGFLDAIKMCFAKYADFKGRAPRAEFWWWQLFSFIVALVLGWVPIVGWLISLALFVPSLAVAWRRLHDIGKEGGWWFLCLIPLVGMIILIVWWCQEGQPHANQYGPNPYGINNGQRF